MTAAAGAGRGSERAQRLEFVEVGRPAHEAVMTDRDARATAATATIEVPSAESLDVAATAATAAARPGEPGWNLWGDLEI